MHDQLNADIQSKRQALANAKDNLDQATTAVKAKSDLEKQTRKSKIQLKV